MAARRTRRGRFSRDVASLSVLRFFPLNIDCDKLRNTGLNILVVNWSFFHNLCQNCFSLSLFYVT